MTGEWTVRQALRLLIGSTLITLVCFLGGYFFYHRSKHKKLHDERYRITSLIQTGPEKEVLKTVYLAELLGLSSNAPTNLYKFNLELAKDALLASPLIRSVELKKQAPSTLYIDYEVRTPIAWIGDYKNIAIDRDGMLFPVAPFFSPKQMPEIYLGLPSFGAPEDSFGRAGGRWKAPLKNRHLNLAFDVLQTFEGSPWKEGLKIQRIDVSNAFAPSLGRREIVLFTEEEILVGGKQFVFPKVLRLSPKDYTQQLQNFFSLRKTMLEDYRRQLASASAGGRFSPRIVDLRISQLAFVENGRSD